MSYIYNNSIFKERRRELRNNQTEAEKILWKYIRNRQIEQCRFRRQFSVGPYILDFYCPRIRLAIEIDGQQHGKSESVVYDKEREEFMNDLDITTIRYGNNDVIRDPRQVVEDIRKHINLLSPLMVRGTKGDTA
ncbi:MAG: endonuclease domain-containing protein [Patescibacteria group bacterium]